MNEILTFLVRYCDFLWKNARYRITDSLTSTSFGGDACLVISSDALRLRFTRDRGQLLLEFQRVDPNDNGSPAKVEMVFDRYCLGTDHRHPSTILAT